MQSNSRIHSIFLGLLFIMVGVIIILINSGYGSWELIWQVWHLWPVFIIYLGIRIIWRGPSGEWFSYGFWLLVVLAVIILLVMNPRSITGPAESGRVNHVVVKRSDYAMVTNGKAVIRFGGGRIALGSTTGEWLKGDFGGLNGSHSIKNTQNTLEVELKQTSPLPKSWWRRHGSGWNGKEWSKEDFR